MPRQRSTRQQRALDEMLVGCGDFRSAQDLHAQLRAGGDRVGLTTVYNNLRALAERGAVDTVLTEDGETLYRRCQTDAHHHHLVCRSCGRTVEVSGRTMERWTAEVAASAGFVDVRHTVEMVGTCGACRGRLEAGLSGSARRRAGVRGTPGSASAVRDLVNSEAPARDVG